MSIQDLGAIGELLGSLLLLASIVYLAIQIKDTKTQIKGSTSQARASAFNQLWSMKLQPGFSDVEMRALNDPGSLTEEDRYVLAHFLIMFMNFYQDSFYQRKIGTLDSEQAGALDSFPMLKAVPIYMELWKVLRVGTFSDEFIEHVDSVLEQMDSDQDQKAQLFTLPR